jgi:hypothetical protein
VTPVKAFNVPITNTKTVGMLSQARRDWRHTSTANPLLDSKFPSLAQFLKMADPKTSQHDVSDPSQSIIEAIEQIDLKSMTYTQLRRMYATVMQAVDDVNEELTVRAEDDNAGDTVRVPVPSPAE